MVAQLAYTSLDEIPQIHATLKQTFLSGKLRPAAYRKDQLMKLAYMLQENNERIGLAVQADLGRPTRETMTLETLLMIKAAIHAVKSLKKWMKPERAPFDAVQAALRPTMHKEPKGVALIIVPFNYPIWTSFSPLIGAIAAGCSVVVKYSEMTPAVSSLMAELFPKYLDPESYRVVNGAVPETEKLLGLHWDQIFFTGSGRVGRVVAAAALKHLTPVALELGGKSPVFVDPASDLDIAARRILWGKTINAGQTCAAPDYILVPAEKQEDLARALQKAYQSFYPAEAGGPAGSQSFGRLVNDAAFRRLKDSLDRTKGHIFLGGETDASQKFIAPTVVKDVSGDDSLMENEIFGPILPIVPVKTMQDAVDFVRSRETPLALYVFTSDPKLKEFIFSNTRSGTFVVNDVVLQCGMDGIPFGGTGESGYGSHLGRHSFDAFTHIRASMESPSWLDMLFFGRFPPYTDRGFKVLALLVGERIPFAKPGTQLPFLERQWVRYLGAGFIVALAAYAARFLQKKRA